MGRDPVTLRAPYPALRNRPAPERGSPSWLPGSQVIYVETTGLLPSENPLLALPARRSVPEGGNHAGQMPSERIVETQTLIS
jgi:hypothetical protein